jgi:hypothetical protein
MRDVPLEVADQDGRNMVRRDRALDLERRLRRSA